MRMALLLFASLLLAPAAINAKEQAATLQHAVEQEAAAADTSAIVLDGKELFRVRGNRMIDSRKRAAAINDRVLQFAQDATQEPDALRVVELADLSRIEAGAVTVLVLTDMDTACLSQ